MKSILVLLLGVTVGLQANADTNVVVASFNAKSNPDTDTDKLATQVERLTEDEGVDIWVFQEVDGWETAVKFRNAAKSGGPNSARWFYMVSRFASDGPNGKPDLVAIIFRADMFHLQETTSLNATMINNRGNWNHRMRPMLGLRLKSKREDEEFWVGTVHFKCCGDGKLRRKLQSEALTNWVGDQEDPVLILGDFNIPIPTDNPDGLPTSDAFQELTSKMSWLRPTNPVATQTGGSMLDAAFHTGMGHWSPESKILEADEDLQQLEDDGFSDHRPLMVKITVN